MSGCVKCGSKVQVEQFRILDRCESPAGNGLSVKVDLDPLAKILTQGVYGPLRATLCDSCGYAVFSVVHPKVMVKAALKARKVLGEHGRSPSTPRS